MTDFLPTRSFLPVSMVFGCAALLSACGSSAPVPTGAAGVAGADPGSQVAVAAMVLDSDALASARPTAACSLDAVDGKPVGKAGFTAETAGISTFSGWAVDATNAAPPGITVVLVGPKTYGLSTLAGQSRPDVARALGTPAAQAAGFQFDATLERVGAGTYHALLWIDTSTGNTLCDTGKRIVVTH